MCDFYLVIMIQYLVADLQEKLVGWGYCNTVPSASDVWVWNQKLAAACVDRSTILTHYYVIEFYGIDDFVK